MQQVVLLVEDHPLVAEAMVSALRGTQAALEIQVAMDATGTLRHLLTPGRIWHRIFLDLDVPGAHGLSLAREIERLQLADRCCVVSASDRHELIGEVKLMGFLGYIVKATPISEFNRCVADVLNGTSAFPSVTLDARSPIRLSRRQEQLLDCVRRGLTSKEIARVVLLSEGTVNNCINAALKALHVTSRSHAVAKALELGLLKVNVRDGDVPLPATGLADSIEDVEHYVTHVLDFARFDRIATQPVLKRVELQSLFQKLELTFKDITVERGVTLVIRSTDAVVFTDAAMVQRILENLVSNAIKFTTRRVLVAARRRGTGIAIQVWDQGAGIAPEDQSAIFTPFYRSPTAERHHGGVGLGLAVVQRFAECLGSQVSLRSQMGRGTVMTLQLPSSSDRSSRRIADV